MTAVHNEKQLKRSKLLGVIISVVVVLVLAAIIICCINVQRQNRIVGCVEGNTLHYKGMVYTGVFEIEHAELGKCLGSVEWKDADKPYSSKIYKIKSEGDAVYLSMGTDHRIYKASVED